MGCYLQFKNENMKSSDHKEESVDKKRYVFFSDPDIIVKRAEASAVVSDFLLVTFLLVACIKFR